MNPVDLLFLAALVVVIAYHSALITLAFVTLMVFMGWATIKNGG